MTCAICNTPTLSGKFIFVNEQKRIICHKCQDKVEAETKQNQKTCTHSKTYADIALCSKPPMFPWVCGKCGADGIDSERDIHYDPLAALKDEKDYLDHMIKQGEKFEDDHEICRGLNDVNRIIRSRLITKINEIEKGKEEDALCRK